jgi:hypothetical protein
MFNIIKCSNLKMFKLKNVQLKIKKSKPAQKTRKILPADRRHMKTAQHKKSKPEYFKRIV